MNWIPHDKNWRSNTCSTIYSFLFPDPVRDYVRRYRDLEGFFGNNLRIPCWGPGGTNLRHIFPCLVKLLATYFWPLLRFKDLQNSRFARADVHSVFKSSQQLSHYSHANTLKMQSALISGDAGSRLL